MKKYIALILSLLIITSTSVVLAGTAVKSSSSSSSSKPSVSLSKPAPAPAPAPAPSKPLPTGGTVSASKPEASKPLPKGGTVSASTQTQSSSTSSYQPPAQQSSGIHWGSLAGGMVLGNMLSGNRTQTVVHQVPGQPVVYQSSFSFIGFILNLIILGLLIYGIRWVWKRYDMTNKVKSKYEGWKK